MSDLPDWCCASGCKKCPAWREQEAKRAERLAKKREAARQTYYARKEAQICISCASPLQDDDSLRCVECEERDIASKRRRRKTSAGRRAETERNRRDRERRLARGLCMYCTRERLPNGRRCVFHVEAQRLYRKRHAAGTKIRREPRQLLTMMISGDLPAETAPSRILKAMRFQDWATFSEICNVLGADENPWSRERNSLMVAVSRLARSGLLERKNDKGKLNAHYRLTKTGRDKADAIRTATFAREAA